MYANDGSKVCIRFSSNVYFKSFGTLHKYIFPGQTVWKLKHEIILVNCLLVHGYE
jgi:hypothetical protein